MQTAKSDSHNCNKVIANEEREQQSRTQRMPNTQSKHLNTATKMLNDIANMIEQHPYHGKQHSHEIFVRLLLWEKRTLRWSAHDQRRWSLMAHLIRVWKSSCTAWRVPFGARTIGQNCPWSTWALCRATCGHGWVFLRMVLGFGLPPFQGSWHYLQASWGRPSSSVFFRGARARGGFGRSSGHVRWEKHLQSVAQVLEKETKTLVGKEARAKVASNVHQWCKLSLERTSLKSCAGRVCLGHLRHS